jgi:hypothetical protein
VAEERTKLSLLPLPGRFLHLQTYMCKPRTARANARQSLPKFLNWKMETLGATSYWPKPCLFRPPRKTRESVCMLTYSIISRGLGSCSSRCLPSRMPSSCLYIRLHTGLRLNIFGMSRISRTTQIECRRGGARKSCSCMPWKRVAREMAAGSNAC